MRSTIVAYVSGLVVMGILDGAWLSYSIGVLYKPGIGHLMADKPNAVAALLFYLMYGAGVTYLITLPAVSAGWSFALTRGAVLGIVAYGTYDFTSLAVMRGWPVNVTVIDTIWGGILTAATATAATLITQRFG